MKKLFLLIFLFFIGCKSSSNSNNSTLHQNITSTYFYIGENSNSNNGYISNSPSVWDDKWKEHFGGIDTPNERNSSYPYYPTAFIPKENPFYVALPYNDFDENGQKKPNLDKIIPWYMPTYQSLMKNRWIKIIHNGKTAYAQIEDAGPNEYNDYSYVFGNSKPINTFGAHAGIDVSPAVKIYLGLNDVDKVDWKFVESYEVEDGPWKNIITTRGVSWLHKNWDTFDINTTWQWQLQGDINTNYDVNLYDIDLFDTDKETIDSLHQDGKKVICYFNAGAYEEWRDDSILFPKKAIGNKMDGWDERWIDIRNEEIKNIMLKRLDLAKEKGCDGVEPDNVDGYNNNTGFNLTYNDQIKYNVFLAYQAHKRGLAIGLKNDLAQINDLSMYFDFALNESCFDYGECELLLPFIQQNKAVFIAEYNTNNKEEICKKSKQYNFQTLFLPLDLDDSFRDSCK